VVQVSNFWAYIFTRLLQCCSAHTNWGKWRGRIQDYPLRSGLNLAGRDKHSAALGSQRRRAHLMALIPSFSYNTGQHADSDFTASF
jgi:hypothetical protein